MQTQVSHSPQSHPLIIIGGGPAGLTAAYEAVKRNLRPLVLEKADKVGGIARTEVYKGYRFDIGGHRFFTKVPEVQQLWQEVLENDFIRTPRLSRIYYQGRFYDYPLSMRNTLANLGPLEGLRILLSYFQARLRPLPEEETFEQWVINRFGRRLYNTFFKTYTEKVWGIPCSRIRAEWAAQRIKGLSLSVAVLNALFGKGEAKTLIKEFDYPRLGPGMMWERFQEKVEARGGAVRLQTETVSIQHQDGRITGIVARRGDQVEEIRGEQFISSMPITELIFRLDPQPPEPILNAARGLKYRDFLIVVLIVNRAMLFPDNWLYIHSPEARVGRIQNFKNWSPEMVPDPDKSSLGMEYFCSEGDDLWEMSDADLIAQAARELDALGLARREEVEDGVVIRQKKAYPVYDGEYRGHLHVLQGYLAHFSNLQTVGRNGMHRYNNQDHSMLAAIRAVQNLFGARHDLWDVNTERSYHEDFTTEDKPRSIRKNRAGAKAREGLKEVTEARGMETA